MLLTYKDVLSNKSKFMRRYIDNLTKPKGYGDFIRVILFRAWRMFPLTRDFLIFGDVKKHLDAKIPDYEFDVIKWEKLERARLKRFTQGFAIEDEYDNLDIDKKLKQELRLIEIIIMRSMGYKNPEISKEINFSPGYIGYLYNFYQENVVEHAIKLLRIMEEIAKLSMSNSNG